MDFKFAKATRKRSRARVAIDGPSGSGKTYTSLIAAKVLADGGRIAVIDTERGSASLYSDKFDFDVLELDTFSPMLYTQAIEAAEAAGYAVIVIDSLSHAWEGEGGALDLVDKAATRMQGNGFAAWKDVTPMHRKMVDAILQCKAHVIVTMRSKMDYIQEKDDRGKTVIRKVGMAPIQRQGMEYEFTLVADMDVDHRISVSKSRCDVMTDAVTAKPDAKFWQPFHAWLNSGDAEQPAHTPTFTKPAPRPAEQIVGELMGDAPAKPAPANGSAIRPLAPEKLRDFLAQKANGLGAASCTDMDRKMVAANLGSCYETDQDNRRHATLKYLTGYASTKDLTPGMVIALKKWLNAHQTDPDGPWMVDAMAECEANSAYTAALEAQGQQTLI